MRKYITDEERYQALRNYRHNYYLRKKEDKEWVDNHRNEFKKYYENNKEKCIGKVKNRYKLKKEKINDIKCK